MRAASRLPITGFLALVCILSSSVRVHPQSPTLPPVTLAPGELFFRVGGTPTVLLGENPYATSATYQALIAAAAAHQKILRLHVSNGIQPHPTYAGEIDAAWACAWDDVFDAAEAAGLYVVPVLDVWSNWSDTLGGWSHNIFNSAAVGCGTSLSCGSATSPSDLLIAGPTQDAWLGWAEALVTRWKSHANIVGWEIFSEIDNIQGTAADVNETNGVAFVEAASARIRAADPGRFVTASLKGVNVWSSLSSSPAIDVMELHPYAGFPPYHGNLDQLILDKVRLNLSRFAKPIFIGESGLDTLYPIDKANTVVLGAGAPVGVNQAIWAGAISGATNARMLWFEDGYDQGYNLCTDARLGAQYASDPRCAGGGTLTLHEIYQDAAAPVERFLAGVDVSGFAPLDMTPGADLIGGALGNDSLVAGWVRDVQSAAPDWPWRPLSGERVTVNVPGHSNDWLVDFYDTTTGDVVETIDADQDATGALAFTLPDFRGSVGFKIRAVGPLDVAVSIRPWHSRNQINVRRVKPFPVAVLTTSTSAGDALDFDAASVSVASVRLGPAGAAPVGSRYIDVDNDGDLDLVMLFRPTDTGLTCGDTSASLTGETTTGRSIDGSDAVRIVGCARHPRPRRR